MNTNIFILFLHLSNDNIEDTEKKIILRIYKIKKTSQHSLGHNCQS